MTGFTFARGNATKLLSAPLYVLGAAVGMIVRRRQNLWVFGCGSGVGEGALALYRWVARADPSARLVWLAGSVRELEDARSAGLNGVLRTGWRGFRLTLRARVIVVTHGFGDVNRFAVRGAFIVQLWHGIPLKKIQLDSPVTFRSTVAPARLLRALYRRQTSHITLMPAASELSAARLQTAFGLPPDRIVVTGDPRDDSVLGGREAAQEVLKRALGDPEALTAGIGQVLLYAPTWRDGEPDPGIPSLPEWAAIARHLESSDSILLLRPHPHGVGAYDDGPVSSPRIRMLRPSDCPDLNPVLPAVDLLITDFSSVAYDFALTGRPIAFLAPDVEQYEASRGLYENYRVFSGGTEVTNWLSLLALLADPNAVHGLGEHARTLADIHHRYRDGENTSRVFDQIHTRLGAFE